MTEADTDQLLKLAQAGDSQARQSLFDRHRDRLRRMITAFLDPQLSARLDPSDVLQEALACAATRFPKYLEEQPIGFYPWLRQIVRENLIIVHRRHVTSERRSVRREDPGGFAIPDASATQLAHRLFSPESSPSQRASLNELKARVQSAMSQLTEPDRELILMRCIEQLSIKETAAALEISESAVKARVTRALQKLGKLVKNHE